ncbi:MAG: transposase, partial [Proteobacteria bacterium]|nr:transposase [Pseudomonadota bacterium]
LPPYSPELNPVEHVWEYLRENAFKNFSLNSLDEVVDILSDGLNFLSNQPEIVRSMTNFDWLNTLCLTCN